jgi:hypothetical protein
MKMHRIAIVMALMSGATVAAELSSTAKATYGRMQTALDNRQCPTAQREFSTFKSQAPDFAAENERTIHALINKCQQQMAGTPGRTQMKGASNVD